jgi:hypothetical protein
MVRRDTLRVSTNKSPVLKKMIVKADEKSLNWAIVEKHIPQSSFR